MRGQRNLIGPREAWWLEGGCYREGKGGEMGVRSSAPCIKWSDPLSKNPLKQQTLFNALSFTPASNKMGRLVKLAFLSLVAMVTAEPYDSHPSGGGYDSHAPTGRYGSYPSSGYGSQPPSYGSGGYASHRQPR
ncbi:hypothetical protein BaRGS_00028131 [Batillaria attramentaria]|uniref:Uncharacterized protein n=1 Tax=Batillaria attramentaria TaxID=370345 RepID=A0ABD0K0W2_9CAEN